MNKDVIIIGAGIAGLYSAFQIKKKHPEWNLLILEKEGRIGGRMGNELYYGTPIAIGAGIGRKNKDKALIQLCQELKVKITDFQSEMMDLSDEPLSIAKTIPFLRSQYRKHPQTTTFENFARKHLGNDVYERFKVSAGYTDYEKEDVFETLYQYGMEDNVSGWTAFYLSWNDLLLALVQKIDMKNIKLRSEVVHIQSSQHEKRFEVQTKHHTYATDRIILATPIHAIQSLLKQHPKKEWYQKIHGQPFLRVYGKFTKESSEIMKTYVPKHSLVEGPLHRIIPMSADKGVYMIAYTDNQDAISLAKYKENTSENRILFCHLLEKALGIKKDTLQLIGFKSYFWKIGTHYYEPLEKGMRPTFIRNVQHPDRHFWVVGEVVSRNQGWVEGALESVDTVCDEWV